MNASGRLIVTLKSDGKTLLVGIEPLKNPLVYT